MTHDIQIEPELLIEDMSIYPRSHVDDSHVNDLTRVLLAGGTLPPPVVDEATKRIVDGWHRVRASIKANKPKIKVKSRAYPDEATMQEEAITLNTEHGLKLTSRDRVRAILLLEQHGADKQHIAEILHTTEDRVVRLRQRVVQVEGEGPMPATPAYWAKKDEEPRTITPAQVPYVQSSPGWRHIQSIRHLTNDLENDLVNLQDETLVEALANLRAAIDTAFSSVAA